MTTNHNGPGSADTFQGMLAATDPAKLITDDRLALIEFLRQAMKAHNQ